MVLSSLTRTAVPDLRLEDIYLQRGMFRSQAKVGILIAEQLELQKRHCRITVDHEGWAYKRPGDPPQ